MRFYTSVCHAQWWEVEPWYRAMVQTNQITRQRPISAFSMKLVCLLVVCRPILLGQSMGALGTTARPTLKEATNINRGSTGRRLSSMWERISTSQYLTIHWLASYNFFWKVYSQKSEPGLVKWWYLPVNSILLIKLNLVLSFYLNFSSFSMSVVKLSKSRPNGGNQICYVTLHLVMSLNHWKKSENAVNISKPLC